MLRPVSARWFEALVPRESVARALEALAGTGFVQLEPDPYDDEAGAELVELPPVDETLARLSALRRRYHHYWPQPAPIEARRDRRLERELGAAMRALDRWSKAAEPRVRRIEALRRDEGELEPLEALCRAARGTHEVDFSDLHDVPDGDSAHAARVFMLPPESETPRLAEPVLVRRMDTRDATWLIVFGRAGRIRELSVELEGRHARVLTLPRWLNGPPDQALIRVLRRGAAVRRLLARDRRAIDELSQRHRVANALGHLRRVAWLAEHLEGITTSEYMARLRGWTCEDDPDAIEGALERAGIPAAVSMPPAPRGRQAPSLCINPPWARPFELFAGLVGTPGRDEADPSLLVALIAPLLFGYMFGDIGHGAVLIAIGLGFRKRFPGTALMIWGGAWAVLFGLLFGSLFGREDVVPALWLHPVSDPLPVLFVPLLFGAFLIFLSFLLNGLEHAWSGRFREWLLTEAGLPLALILFGAALIHPQLFWAVALMLLAQYAGLVAAARHKGAVALVGALGELLEALMQLIVNTLSFIRVGAFALAHAGLSLAVISLADSTTGVLTWLLVMAVGNALIIAIEGLVASIQTTRLVLFEFFNRFLSAGGRAFEPLAPPSASLLPTFKEVVP